MIPSVILATLIAYSNPTPLQFAIMMKESEITNNSPFTVGDNGRSLGAYQIQEAYWEDSGIGLPYLPWVYSPVLSEIAMKGYWKRYKADTDEKKARIHNGGPNGMNIKATQNYWDDIKRRLK